MMTTHLGMFFLGTETVSHHPAPANNDTFSSTVNSLISCLISASKKDLSNWSFVLDIAYSEKGGEMGLIQASGPGI
jgi:hypothetical protein